MLYVFTKNTGEIIKFKIRSMPDCKTYNALPFGRQIEFNEALKTFKENARCMHLSQKRQTYTKAIRDAIALYDVDEYYCRFYADKKRFFDDSFEFYYTTKTQR